MRICVPCYKGRLYLYWSPFRVLNLIIQPWSVGHSLVSRGHQTTHKKIIQVLFRIFDSMKLKDGDEDKNPERLV